MSEQARHPGRTPAQRRVLDAIGRGDRSPRMSRVLRDALLRHGLIVPIEPKRFTLGIGAVLVEQFDMPVNVHMQWRAAQLQPQDRDDLADAPGDEAPEVVGAKYVDAG